MRPSPVHPTLEDGAPGHNEHSKKLNGSERVDAAQVQLAFSQVASLVVPPELAPQIAEAENKDRAERKLRGPHGRLATGGGPPDRYSFFP